MTEDLKSLPIGPLFIGDFNIVIRRPQKDPKGQKWFFKEYDKLFYWKA